MQEYILEIFIYSFIFVIPLICIPQMGQKLGKIPNFCYFSSISIAISISSSFLIFGSRKVSNRAITNTFATGFPENTSLNRGGNSLNISGTCVKPIPILRERAAIVVFLDVKPHLATIFIPLTTIEPNIIIVQPPRTGSGRVEKNAPIFGNKAARIRVKAPNIMVNLFTTFVIATRPTFWLNDVIGVHPNRPDTALRKPSQAREPCTSLSVISLPRPPTQTAVVSPIVSAAETRKTTTRAIIAFKLNSGLNGRKCGIATKLASQV